MNAPSSPAGLAAGLDFRQRLMAMLGLCCVLIMVALDQTVVGTAMPTVVADLHGFALYAWVGTSYLLTSVITVPVFGKLGDDHGRKPFVLTAIVLFTAASMLCGLAQDMLQLVLARALQGVGGGMLVATTFACVPDLFPHTRERLRWQVMLSASFGLANAIGPSLGGFLTEYLGWRWVFFVNLPVGVASLWLVWRFLPVIRHDERPPSRLDWQGAVLIALFLGSLQLTVEWLPQHKPPLLLAALAGLGLAALAALLWWEKRSPNPLLPPSMLSHKGLAPLFGLSLLMGFGMFAVMYYAPLMFQAGFGLSPNQAGLLVTPLVVFITIGSMLNGRIVQRLKHPTRLLGLGLLMFAATAALLARTTPSTPHALIFANMMMGGLGLGLLMPNLTIFVQQLAPRQQLGVSTAMLQSTRMVGGMLGTAVMGAVVSHRFRESVEAMLTARHGESWRSWLADPQTLLNADSLAQFRHAAVGADGLLAASRELLVDAIHCSQWLVALGLLLGLWLVRKVPAVRLDSAVPEQELRHE
ncbi:MDR family MFS transporter [Chromobacterium vaccinii]|uniref:MFS transporter n=1 Tax=Chromobacterium vaccinii TaxID=1108595 RepID=A0A1D9LJ08_9NEIS|nr:MDR family MFS transporter [Chromobacterium vaccinii]AOZ51213.1 MFS transporter [Chromobacterium vaccinii]QND82289.1 putative MFS-type transporter [Chromobacterium vaccinii]QND87519.1 putative MFS-type transporter [Chromobacterium vaccinii]